MNSGLTLVRRYCYYYSLKVLCTVLWIIIILYISVQLYNVIKWRDKKLTSSCQNNNVFMTVRSILDVI